MKDRIITFAILIPAIILAILPSIPYSIPITINSNLWYWLVLASGFLAFLFIYSNARFLIKALVVYCFINCFFSRAPFLSFTAYLSLIVCAYYYLLALRIKKWNYIFNAMQCIFWLTILFTFVQAIGKDTMMNFGRDEPVFFGTIANNMRSSSMVVIVGLFLICKNILYIIPMLLFAWMTKSSGAMVSIIPGSLIYLLFTSKVEVYKKAVITFVIFSIGCAFILQNNFYSKITYGRLPVWKKTVELTREHPLEGWGIGTYKVIVPALTNPQISGGYANPWVFENTKGDWLAWRQAHNCWLQFLFEGGLIGLGLLLLLFFQYMRGFLQSPRTSQMIIAVSALLMLAGNMCIHFPTRLTQAVLIILLFLAYYEHILKGEIQ